MVALYTSLSSLNYPGKAQEEQGTGSQGTPIAIKPFSSFFPPRPDGNAKKKGGRL